MPIRLCWCGRDATHVTGGGIADYLCELHAGELRGVVKLDRIFQDSGPRYVPVLKLRVVA